MTIATIIAKRAAESIFSVAPDALISDVVALLAQKRIGAVPVLDGATLVGILSERDVLINLANQGGAILTRHARDIMTAPVISVSSDVTLIGGLGLMTKRRIRHLPVVDDGVMVGFISIGDLVKGRIDEMEAEANALRDYIQSA